MLLLNDGYIYIYHIYINNMNSMKMKMSYLLTGKGSTENVHWLPISSPSRSNEKLK